ncbi:MAG: DUF2087 domain-containing protein [Gammaproteobacteria bacterium]|nr:DUF2087 domain-containing protein [Gammaproteobacteria bacterium]
MNSREELEKLLRRLLGTGRFEGFPRHPDHLDSILAVAASQLHRRRPYGEREVNDALSEWLQSVNSPVDHVTLRRRMVDCGFLKRTTNGSRYFLNYGRVAGVLGDPALEVDAGAIIDDLHCEREERKRARMDESAAR